MFCCRGSRCSQSVNYDRSHLADRVSAHIQSKSHVNNHRKIQDGGPHQVPLRRILETNEQENERRKTFNAGLTRALVAAGIPLHKLENKILSEFLHKYTGFPIPATNMLRYKEVPEIMDATLNSIRTIVGENDIYFQIDETTDLFERKQANIIVGVLTSLPSKPMLMHVEFMEESDASAILGLFVKSCGILWNSIDPPFHRVKLLVTDQAATMLSVGRKIKEDYCKDMLHVTCLAHCLNRVSEKVRQHHPRIHEFLNNLKESLRNSTNRRCKYKQVTKLPLLGCKRLNLS